MLKKTFNSIFLGTVSKVFKSTECSITSQFLQNKFYSKFIYLFVLGKYTKPAYDDADSVTPLKQCNADLKIIN